MRNNELYLSGLNSEDYLFARGILLHHSSVAIVELILYFMQTVRASIVNMTHPSIIATFFFLITSKPQPAKVYKTHSKQIESVKAGKYGACNGVP